MSDTETRPRTTRLVEVSFPEGMWRTADFTEGEGWGPFRPCVTPEEETGQMTVRMNTISPDSNPVQIRPAVLPDPDGEVVDQITEAWQGRYAAEDGGWARIVKGDGKAIVGEVLEMMATLGLAVVDRTRLDPT